MFCYIRNLFYICAVKHFKKHIKWNQKKKLTSDIVKTLANNLQNKELKNAIKSMAFIDYKGKVEIKQWVMEITSIYGVVFMRFEYNNKSDYEKDVKIMKRIFVSLPKSETLDF